MDSQPNLDTSSIEAQTTRMRCPQCRKLYSVDARSLGLGHSGGGDAVVWGNSMVSAASAPRFDCTGCGTRFGVVLVKGVLNPLHSATLDTFIDEAQGSTPEARIAKRVPQAARPAPLRERSCPKCGSKTPQSSLDCQKCGVVFARLRSTAPDSMKMAEDLQLAGRRDLIALWESVLSDYENEQKHEAFVAACRRADSLPFAAHVYSELLALAPNEDIATRMRHRIVGFASYKAETSSIGPAWNYRVPGFNALGIMLGTMLLVLGALLPGTGNLSGIGIAMLVLSLGVRFALRPRA